MDLTRAVATTGEKLKESEERLARGHLSLVRNIHNILYHSNPDSPFFSDRESNMDWGCPLHYYYTGTK